MLAASSMRQPVWASLANVPPSMLLRKSWWHARAMPARMSASARPHRRTRCAAHRRCHRRSGVGIPCSTNPEKTPLDEATGSRHWRSRPKNGGRHSQRTLREVNHSTDFGSQSTQRHIGCVDYHQETMTLAYIPSPTISQFSHRSSNDSHLCVMHSVGNCAGGMDNRHIDGSVAVISIRFLISLWSACLRALSAHDFITSSPRLNVSSDRMATGRKCSAFGMADLASGAACCSERWPHGHGAVISTIQWPCWLTPSLRACW